MRKSLVILSVVLFLFGISGTASATITPFNFEHPSNQGELTYLQTYMNTTFGQTVGLSGVSWVDGTANPFGSDFLGTTTGTGILDFDTGDSGLKILSTSFRYWVTDYSDNPDLMLDAYDDTISNWRSPSAWSIDATSYNQVGNTGTITFDSAWEVTQLRFHNSGYQVAMDDLVINDNRGVPEPASMLLFGIGMLGFGVVRRKRN